MISHEQAARSGDVVERRLRPVKAPAWEQAEPRTIVIRQGSGWQSLAVLFLCLLLLSVVLLAHYVLRGLDARNQMTAATMSRIERKMQMLESTIGFDTSRRQLLLGMRNEILKANPKASLAEAYRYADLAVTASEKYPAVDPLFLLAIGIVESGYDPLAHSPADARGLYQIWPSTGRIIVRALGWSYDDQTLYDPEKNTEAAAFYLDVLFTTYNDPQLVLAEYNGGPLNAGYFRASSQALAHETRSYVPRVIDLYGRLKDAFEKGIDLRPELMHRDAHRRGKSLGSPVSPPSASPPAAAPTDGGRAARSSSNPSSLAR
jgi:hypothetical protein